MRRWLPALTTIAVLVGLLAFAAHSTDETDLAAASSSRARLSRLSIADKLPSEALESQPAAREPVLHVAHVALYDRGQWRGMAWRQAERVRDALDAAMRAASSSVETSSIPDTAVVVLSGAETRVTSSNRGQLLSNVHRGVRGLWLRNEQGSEFWSPTETIAHNRSLEQSLEHWAEARGVEVAQLLSSETVVAVEMRQFLVKLDDDAPAHELLRGNQLVRLQDVTEVNLRAFEQRLARWMLNAVHPDGRMTYLYWPSAGNESKRNNEIRQFMATVCLGRIARAGTPGAAELAKANLAYNMEHFYRTAGELGFILHQGKAKLGAAALSLIAIVESDARAEFSEQEQALKKTLSTLWHPDGSFQTFLLPPERNDNQNFYPGEALLAWASLLQNGEDPDAARRIALSREYYRRWHLENRNPAFVPWHTQAYAMLWQKTKDLAYRDWIFEMNDWLLRMQEHSRAVYDDTEGRFYHPHEDYGPPHASSTGVYLEGLIDAFALAREAGDSRRVAAYRRSILLGLRSAMQLEFADDVDMFYISKRERVRGGLRTTVYDNSIRVDNVQHVLMAVQKILRTFEPTDYVAGERG